MGLKTIAAGLAASLAMAAPAHAVVGYADVVLDYFDSGAGGIAGPYGGTFDGVSGVFPVPVSTSVVLGPDGPIADFLSLPTGSYITVGFTDEFIFDGVGNDLFIGEAGVAGETANVFVSSNNVDFVFLGLANDAVVTAFDLGSIGFLGKVTAVKIVGLDSLGGSPGFDVSFVQGLPGSIAVPEPATWAMMILGFGLAGTMVRRGRRTRFA